MQIHIICLHFIKKPVEVPLYRQMQLQWSRIYSDWRNWRSSPPQPDPTPLHFKCTCDVNIPHMNEFITELSTWDSTLQRNVGIITAAKNIHLLANAIETGDLITVSDASIGTRCRAALSYILSTRDLRGTLKGSAPVDCNPDDIESTRAEIYGSIAIHTILQVVSNVFAISSGEVAVYCNNKDALCKNKIVPDEISFPRFFRPNVDTKLQIQELRQSLKPIHILPVHIKGHQDDDSQFDIDTAPLSVRLNIEVDEASKEFLKTDQGPFEPRPTQQRLPCLRAYLSVNDEPIYNNIDYHVKLNYFGARLEERFMMKTALSRDSICKIHWLAIERAFRKLPLQEKLATFNLLHNKWNTNMKIASWDAMKDPLCQRCTTIEETTSHIFQCKSIHATNTHKNAMKKLKCALRRAQTAPIIQRAIVQCVEKNRKGYEDLLFRDIIVPENQKELATKVFRNQERLGSMALLQGFLSTDWSVMQNVYNGTKDILDYQTDWMAKVIRALWTYSLTMWKDRCSYIHGPDTHVKGSKRRRELLNLIEKELDRTKLFGDHEICQLRKKNNMKGTSTATTSALEIWLGMIRDVKESSIMRKRETRITTTRMQSITRFLCRPAPA